MSLSGHTELKNMIKASTIGQQQQVVYNTTLRTFKHLVHFKAQKLNKWHENANRVKRPTITTSTLKAKHVLAIN